MTRARAKILRLKRTWLATGCLFIFALLSSCAGTRALMSVAPVNPKGAPAQPAITVRTLTEWEATGRSAAKAALMRDVYGRVPAGITATASPARHISDTAFSGLARIEEMTLTLTAGRQSAVGQVVIVTPANARGPLPIIIMQNFCPNHDVIKTSGITPPPPPAIDCGGGGAISGVFGYFFGQYIVSPPITDILNHGYALAVLHPPQWVPDDAQTGAAALARLSADKTDPWGTIAAWAQLSAELAVVFKSDPRFSGVIAYGHSRYGKSALVAAMQSENIDAVIAHQSGTGGASLNRDKPGETVAAITKAYPHWFTPGYKVENKSVDQHHLLATIAPRPVLLGNAKRDVWSDPSGAFRAAQGANSVYHIYGKSGLTASKLTQFKPGDDVAFWMRPGTHGVTTEDWPAFLDFLDAHFK